MYNMKAYFEAYGEDPFNYLPLTFHIRNGTDDPEFTKFMEYYQQRESICQENEKIRNSWKDEKKEKPKKIHNIWIVKPGEGTNRGNGISVF